MNHYYVKLIYHRKISHLKWRLMENLADLVGKIKYENLIKLKKATRRQIILLKKRWKY